MIERLVENWLTKVNEKSFQIPFCQMLTAEGYRVVHLARHGSFEEGKDVLAIMPDGTPCAFQLKGSSSGKIAQREWGKYVDQVNRLVEIPIKHPSVDEKMARRVFFVTNGELDEEVRVEIVNRNSDWKRRGHPELEVIVKGDLLARFIKLQDDLWPLHLSFEKELLEFYMADGHGYLDKPKFAAFIESLLIRDDLSRAEISRRLASSAIFGAYALSPFADLDNHVALIEGWVIYLASIIALAEKKDIPTQNWEDQANLALQAIENNLADLSDELEETKYFVAGNSLVDAPFYRGRLTWLISLMCVHSIWKKRVQPDWQPEVWVNGFVLNNLSRLELWGEAATPQFLAVIWWLDTMQLEHLADRILFEMVKGIVGVHRKGAGLSDPYHHLGEVVMMRQGIIETVRPENFKGRSYVLESLIELLVRRGWRGALAEIWKPITAIHYALFEPDSSSQYCLWHCEDGKMYITIPKSPQSWHELQEKASTCNLTKIPEFLQNNPEILMLFLIVYPHRIQTDVVKYLDGIYYSDKHPPAV